MHTQDTVQRRFFAPVENARQTLRFRRKCPEYSDEDFIEAGIGRVIANVQSGRDWVQQLRMRMNSRLTVGNFFRSLHSSRRLNYLQEVAQCVCRQVDEQLPDDLDPLSIHPELADFAVYASDGHFEQPSVHAKEKDAVGCFLSANLRSHSLTLLDITRPVVKREHDMHALKRLGSTFLRMGQPAGTKVIHVYDPAGIDYLQWYKWKAKGVYIISREKSNSTADVIGINHWDKNDPRNTGVLSDELVGVFCGVMMRRVRYRDPATETEYSFMTGEMTLPPGLIAFLYKLRWDIEKMFDEKKNKLMEKKDWACSRIARSQQAQFICMTHNLMLLLERNLLADEGISDAKVQEKRQKRSSERCSDIQSRGLTANPLVEQYTRATQRSLQFIRWLRHCLLFSTCYSEAVKLLRPFMEQYLS